MIRSCGKTLVAILGSLLWLGCGGGDDKQAADAGQNADGGSPDGSVVVGKTPVLDTATAQIVGRAGRDLRITVAGSDPDGDVAVLVVSYVDGAGNPVLVFDSSMKGTLDSAEGPAAFDTSVEGNKTVSGKATIRGLFNQHPNIMVVTVAMRDRYGNTSNSVIAPVGTQPVRATGESCDPNAIADRCDTGLGCRGTPSVCGEGQAPTISKFSYLTTANGPRLLFEGTEPDDDLGRIHLEFQSAAGSSITLDLDGDDVPDASNFDINAQGTSYNGTFFVSLNPMVGFDKECPQIVANPIDLAGHQGAEVTGKPVAIPTRGTGAVCDPRGFDVCSTNSVCSPGILGATNKCNGANAARQSACKAAPVLDPAKGITTAVGRAEGVSLWDVPLDCSAGNPTGRPEGVAKLHLASAAPKLILSSEHKGTDFDSAIYLLKACPDTNNDALGCADDSPDGSAASTLELTNVPAGDYLIVVDSFQTTGGNYELTVQVQ